MALLNSLTTKGEWFARKYFVLIGACLFKTFKKLFMENSVFLLSRIFKSKIFVNSLLNFVSLKPLQFLYLTILACCLGMCYFITVTISLWKSERPVSEDFWKQFALLVKKRSMHDGFEGFLKQAGCLIISVTW